MNRLDGIEGVARRDLPPFRSGDTLRVSVRVVEGEKERTQIFEGVCIRRRGNGSSESFTVRKVSYGVGVERIFPVQGPVVEKVEIKSRGHVRRARLYYLRDLRGKKARLRSKIRDLSSLLVPAEEIVEAPEPPPAEAEYEEKGDGPRRGRAEDLGDTLHSPASKAPSRCRSDQPRAASHSHATTSKRTRDTRPGCSASHALAPRTSRSRLRKSTASSGAPAARERRVLTSTITTKRPRIATR